MGNSSSGLQIRLNPSVGNTAGKYLAGSKISGTVYVQTDGNGGGGDAGLELYLTGKEDVMVAYEIQVGNDDERRQEIRHSYSKRDIVRIDIPLVQAGSGSFLEAGNTLIHLIFSCLNIYRHHFTMKMVAKAIVILFTRLKQKDT